ncbi:MAG TPA: hypothetical protein VGP71_07840 [Burkholderiales bacterium]|nr:hypothetical protein [Burkholderiales bacterium]
MLKKLLSLLGLGRKRATLVVTVPPGRRGCGALLALDAEGKDLLGGPISVAARADETLARGHGNPARDIGAASWVSVGSQDADENSDRIPLTAFANSTV